jgi:Tol biopolymer transport system component
VAISLCALVFFAATPARASEVWLDVSKAADRKIVLALPPPAANEGPDELTLRQTLENDLVVTGYFRVLPLAGPSLAQAEKERGSTQTDHAAWAAYGAELVLRVDVARQAGRLVLRAVLFDVGARVQLLAREESDAPAEAPRLAHRLSDAVLRALTGAPAPAALPPLVRASPSAS